MTRESRLTIPRGAAILAAVLLLLSGSLATYLLMRSGTSGGDRVATPARDAAEAPRTPQPASAPSAPSDAPLPDVVVPLAPEAAKRAGIVVATVTSGASATEVRLPGIIEPNAYRQVVVTPVVSGRVTRVSAQLGDRVRRGATMAQIYSPERAEAQTRYIAAQAMLGAHDRELQRTEKLVEIGAASRQELERIHAEHASQTAAVQSARSQLELLGVPASTIDAVASGHNVSATISVPAPIDGVVTERGANVGLNVDPATKLFTVVDLATVWVVADVYEKDFSRVRVGSEATISTSAYPGQALRGKVGYIDPQVSPATRTAKVRVEVPNPRSELRLGMYADVAIAGAPGASVTMIPRSAVQNVGDRTVVYLGNPKEPGTFVEREVRTGRASGTQVEVESGVHAGDLVVTDGSFFLRAERERLGLGAGARASHPAARPGPPAPSGARHGGSLQTSKIVLNEQGYRPARVMVRAGTPVRLTFLRVTDKTCGTEIAFPSLNVRRALPLNEPVDIEFTPAETGDITFVCGMNMLKGVVVVQ
jgi:membrane fusion protein, heavy metal efflux system